MSIQRKQIISDYKTYKFNTVTRGKMSAK